MRGSAKKFLSSALRECAASHSAESQNKELSEKLELEIFRQSNRLVNSKYRKLSRKVIFGLKRDSWKEELLGQKISVKDFVALFIVQ